jgi:adenosylcobinamide-phosphate synthase
VIPATAELIVAAFCLDLIFGDPRWLPHPVVLIGRFVNVAERFLRQLKMDSYTGGAVLCIATVSLTASATYGLLKLAGLAGGTMLLVVSCLTAYSTLAMRSLHRESLVVANALEQGHLETARELLSRIVGRDTSRLDQESIWRATIETVAENANDGVVAPLFWLAVGGPVGAMAFKAASTLDSMVGYKNDRYLKMGMFSARLDDLLCFVPARITALLLVCAAPLAGLSFSGAIRVYLRDRNNHASPNSGQPESAAAGALGVQLGGPSSYGGVIKEKPLIGNPDTPCNAAAYRGMIRLLYISSFMMAALSAIILFIRSTRV